MRYDYAHLSHYDCGQNQGVPQRKQSVAKGIRKVDRSVCSSGMQVGAEYLLSRYYIFAASCENIGL